MSDIVQNHQGFFSKLKRDPILPIGISGFLGVVAYSAYNYRKKSASTKTSVYVIHTRVAAQGLVISVLTIGLVFHMYKSYNERNLPRINAFNRSSSTEPSSKET